MKLDIAYLVGALRDGSVYYYKGNRSYFTIFYQKFRNWLEYSIGTRIKRVFNVKYRIKEYKKGHYRLQISNKRIYNFWRQEYEFPNEGKSQSDWLVPRKILNSSLEEKSIYLRAFFDTEGDCSPESSKSPYIGISQKNKVVIEQIKQLFTEIGIETTKIHVIDKKSNTHRIAISNKKNIQKFYNKVGSEHPEKKEKLKFIISRL